MVGITVLPLDLECALASNLRKNEIHSVTTASGKVNRIIIPNFGAFFKKTVELRDSAGKALTYKTDYEITYHYELFSELTGQGVSAMVVITNTTAKSPFSLTYHAVGGNFSLSVQELSDVIEYIDSADKGKINFEDIIDKPTAYVPEKHDNDWWQVLGLESTVSVLNMLGDAISKGRAAITEANADYWVSYVEEARVKVNAFAAAVMTHVTDKANPHATDKNKVGLNLINNWAFATVAQSTNATVTTAYQPIGGIYNYLTTNVIPLLEAHRLDRATAVKPDPHNLTLAQINAYSVAEINALFNTRLAKTAIATSTATLNGITYNTMYTNMRSNLDTSNVVQGTFVPYDATKVFQMSQIAPVPSTGNITNYVLCGDRQYRDISTLIAPLNSNRTGVVFLGNDGSRYTEQGAINAIRAYNPAGGIKEGTQAVACWSRVFNDWRRTQQIIVMVRTGNNWVRQL